MPAKAVTMPKTILSDSTPATARNACREDDATTIHRQVAVCTSMDTMPKSWAVSTNMSVNPYRR